MFSSGELQTSCDLNARCTALSNGVNGADCNHIANLEEWLSECDSLIQDIDQATDWRIIGDKEAIEMLQIVYRCRGILIRIEDSGNIENAQVQPSQHAR